MSQTVHQQVQAGFVEQIQKVLSASIGACATDVYGRVMPGVNVITYDDGVGAFTLVDPVAGAPTPPAGTAASLGQTGYGGDDGKVIVIECTTAHAHTVTTASASKINGAYNTLTFGAVGDIVVLRCYGGQYYFDIDSSSVVPSAV